jgi:hypothetical protein
MLPTVCFSSLTVHVFYLSVACIVIAYLLLIPCMLFTSLLHVILVVCTYYFSHMYQSSLCFCSRIPSPPVFPYHSSLRDHCFLHGCPSFTLPLNPSLKHIFAPLSTCFFPSVLLVAYYYIRSVDWTCKRNVLVCSFFYDGQSMFPITYHSPFPCYLYQHEYLINHQFRFNVSPHYSFLDIPSSLHVVHHCSCLPFLISPPSFFSSSHCQC